MAILTDCPSCARAITIDARDALLTVFRATAGRRPLATRFGFVCPWCAEVVSAETTPQEELDLTRAGVPVEMIDDPRDRHPSTAGRRPRWGHTTVAAPAFTSDDVRALRELLDRDDWLDRLLEAD